MISLKDIKDDFKSSYNWTDNISIGKIDNNQEKAVCFYNSQRQLAKIPVIGGKANKKYNLKPITVLLRYTKNKDTADIQAQNIHDHLNERHCVINNHRVFIELVYENPIDLGSDDKNVYEYSIEANYYVEID